MRILALQEVNALWTAVPELAQPMGCMALRALAGVPQPNTTWLHDRIDEQFYESTLLPAAQTSVPQAASAPEVLGAAWLLRCDAAWPVYTTFDGAACMAAALLAARRWEGYAEQAAIMPTALAWLIGTEVDRVASFDLLLSLTSQSLPPRYALLQIGIRWLLDSACDACAAAVEALGDAGTLPDERALATVIILQQSRRRKHETMISCLDSTTASRLLESFASAASRDRRNAAGEEASAVSSLMQRYLHNKTGLDSMLVSMMTYPFEQLAWPARVPVQGVTQGLFTPLHAHLVAALASHMTTEEILVRFKDVVEKAIEKNTPAVVHAAAEVVAGVLQRCTHEWALQALVDGIQSNEHGEAWAAAARFVLGTSDHAHTIIAAVLAADVHPGAPTWALQRRLSLLDSLLAECPTDAQLQSTSIALLERLSACLPVSAGVRGPFASLLVRVCGVCGDGNDQPTHRLLSRCLHDDPAMCCAVTEATKHATASLRRYVTLQVLQRVLRMQEATTEGSVAQMEARAALVVARYVCFFSPREATAALDAVRQVVENTDPSWAPRAAAVVFLQTLAFRCAPLLDARSVLDVALGALTDANTDVRDAACNTLSGALAMAGATQTWLDGKDASTLQGVLARRALVAAWPYDVPPWMPAVLLELSRATSSRDVSVREAAKSALREAARTHEEQQRLHIRAVLGEDVFAVDGGGYFV